MTSKFSTWLLDEIFVSYRKTMRCQTFKLSESKDVIGEYRSVSIKVIGVCKYLKGKQKMLLK